MSVGNEPDRYWSYCHRCKKGGVEMKSHVVLGNRAPTQSEDLSLPADMIPVSNAEPHIQNGVGTFLTRKNMDLLYLPPTTYFSESRKRLLIATNGEYMGRDTTDASPQKWLTYNRQTYVPVSINLDSGLAVLTEDTFSAYKIAHACVGGDYPSVFCTLGTKISQALMLLLIRKYTNVFSYYDGDIAGWRGAALNHKSLRALGIGVALDAQQQCAPASLDPKDQSIEDIRRHVRRAFN